MSDYKTEVIILKSWESKEYDRIYSVFSREYGKMRVVGIGTRKVQAKLASNLEPFTRTDIFLVKCRYLDRVRGTIILRQYKKLKQDLNYLVEGRRTVDIIEKLLPDNESNEKIFIAMKEYLKFLNKLAEKGSKTSRITNSKKQNKVNQNKFVSQLAQLALIWKAIYWSGYFPRFSNCAYCNRKITEVEQYTFVLSRGISCGCQNNFGDDLKIILKKNTIKIIKFLVTQEIQYIKKFQIKIDDLQYLQQFTKLILEQIIDRKVIL